MHADIIVFFLEEGERSDKQESAVRGTGLDNVPLQEQVPSSTGMSSTRSSDLLVHEHIKPTKAQGSPTSPEEARASIRPIAEPTCWH